MVTILYSEGELFQNKEDLLVRKNNSNHWHDEMLIPVILSKTITILISRT